MAQKILVTGGAGFIGSHLCNLLIENPNNEVICLDNFFTGKKRNIESLMDHPRFSIVGHDITDIKTPIDLKIPGGIDQIYNLACPASPIHYQFDPIETIKANTIGVINVLEFAKLNGAKVLQTSTSEIYGDPLEHPQQESYKGNVNTLGPRACYDEGKRVAETLFTDYHRKYGIPIAIARIFNTYGSAMDKDDGRVVSNFIVQALKNKPITIYGDGDQTRSFCYITDNIRGLQGLMEADYPAPVNIGNPNEFTIKELAEKVIGLTNSKSELIYMDLPQDDPKVRKPQIDLAKNLLGWQPTVSLKEGLEKTIDYFKSVLKPDKE